MVIALKRKTNLLKEAVERNIELREVIEEDSNYPPKTESNTNQKEVRKIREGGKHGGNAKWPLWMLQLVLELLVNGTPPSSIPANIVSHVAIMNPNTTVKEVPSVSWICRCRTILRIIGETLASYRLAKAEDWKQLFIDGTS